MGLSTPAPVNAFSSFGDMLKYLRKRSHLTQVELARAVGYSREQINHLESGRRNPDPTTIAALFIPALDLERSAELASRLLTLAEATRTGSTGNTADASARNPLTAADHSVEVEARAAHHLAAEAAELAQGDLLEAAQQYFLADEFKAAADVLFDQGTYLSNQGRAHEAVEVLDRILAALRKSGTVSDHGDSIRRLLTTRGDLVLNTAQADEAEGNYREALALTSGAVRTTLIYRLALSLTQRGRATEALAMVQGAYADLPPQHRLISAQLKIVECSALLALAHFDEAEKVGLEALTIAERIALAMPFLVAGIRARAHNALGTIHAIHHHLAVALEHWKQAVETAHLTGLRSLEFRCQGNIANVLYEIGDLTGAMTACEAAIDGLRAVDDLHGMAHFLHLRANLCYIRGDIEASLTLAEEACAVKRQLGERRSLLVSVGQQIKSLIGLDRVAEASAMLDQGISDVAAIGDDRLHGYWLMLACELSLLSGDYSGARQAVNAAMALPSTSGEVKLEGDCTNHLAMVNLAGGDVENAVNVLSSSGSIGIPEIDFERELIKWLLDRARGESQTMIDGATATASRARGQGFLIYALRADRLLQALSDPAVSSLPYNTFPALVYGKVSDHSAS